MHVMLSAQHIYLCIYNVITCVTASLAAAGCGGAAQRTTCARARILGQGWCAATRFECVAVKLAPRRSCISTRRRVVDVLGVGLRVRIELRSSTSLAARGIIFTVVCVVLCHTSVSRSTRVQQCNTPHTVCTSSQPRIRDYYLCARSA